MVNRSALQVLLVEDDEVNAEHLLRCFRLHGPNMTLSVAATGAAALEQLRGADGVPPLPQPYIILLELYLPGMSGLEFLQTLRQDPKLKSSGVFVISDTATERERAAAYELNIVGYFLRAKVETDCASLVQTIDAYRALVELPTGE